MRIHFLQHVPFEDAANIAVWAQERGYSVSTTRLFDNEYLPEMGEFDWLVIMGGPMSTHEEEKYPWLVQEKEFIKKSIESGKRLIGVCLGAQLIADILGAEIKPQEYKEIGWFDISLTEAGRECGLFASFPDRFEVFHWHGDMFSLPKGAIHLAYSEAGPNQAFLYENRILALQFHLDYALAGIQKMIDNCKNELVPGKYIQTDTDYLLDAEKVNQIRRYLFELLDKFADIHTI